MKVQVTLMRLSTILKRHSIAVPMQTLRKLDNIGDQAQWLTANRETEA